MSIIPVYCPRCAEQGRKKLLLKTSSDTKGDIFPWCKIHGNVKVTLPIKPE